MLIGTRDASLWILIVFVEHFIIYEKHFEFQMSIKTACPHTSVHRCLFEAASVSNGGKRGIYPPAQSLVAFGLPHLELAK